jgi:hypothetical protein
VARYPFLVVHPDALSTADLLAEHRWAFVAASLKLLARYSNGEALGPLRDWKGQHGVEFAPNGRVSYRYVVTLGAERRSARTEWHLKQGDNTTRDSAARIYFDRVDFSLGARVVLFHIGPHPADGEVSIHLDLSKTDIDGSVR